MAEETQTIKELADAEAARAEAESPDEAAPEDAPSAPVSPSPEEEEAAEEEETPSAPEPPESLTGPQSEGEVNKVLDKLDKESQRHVKRVREILGDEFEAQQAWALTFPPPTYFPVEGGPMPEAHKTWVLGLLGEPSEPEYAVAEDAEKCESCKGLGKTLTGSLVPEQRTKLCKDCQGAGWKPKPVAYEGLTTTPLPGAPRGDENGGERAVSIPDVWGRPFGHPHYGIPPAQVGV